MTRKHTPSGLRVSGASHTPDTAARASEAPEAQAEYVAHLERSLGKLIASSLYILEQVRQRPHERKRLLAGWEELLRELRQQAHDMKPSREREVAQAIAARTWRSR